MELCCPSVATSQRWRRRKGPSLVDNGLQGAQVIRQVVLHALLRFGKHRVDVWAGDLMPRCQVGHVLTADASPG